MAHIKRMSLALALALIMVMALAGTALAFEPPGNSGLDGFDFPAITEGPFDVVVIEGACHPTMPNAGPWNAFFVGAVPFGTPANPANCAT
jgi:hypothetical protein